MAGVPLKPKLLVWSLLTALWCVGLLGCSSQPSQPASDQRAVRDALYQQYGAWRGVPYRLGGLSTRGVDCSGLVQLTYQNVFSHQLPRTTKDLARVGKPVKPGERRSGDLVFFKIGLWQDHVGIYLENGKFMHASASKGVMISSLDETYWHQRYWKTLRPLDLVVASR